MNKGKMTSKALKEMFSYELRQCKVFSIGYCTLQYLLYFHSPCFYTSGVYGWNYDSYFINNEYVINTGYRGMFGYSVDYDLSHSYENKAAAIVNDYSIVYSDNLFNRVNMLKDEYVKDIQLTSGEYIKKDFNIIHSF